DLEVMPVLSPHPVETNVFMFRSLAGDGYRSYIHLADTVSFSVLKKMIRNSDGDPGVSPEYVEEVRRRYLTPASVKKIDVGGGMVHGHVGDFSEDKSNKLILSHTSSPLNNQEKEIGSFVAFGTVDVLIPNYSEFAKRSAYEYLSSYFPQASRPQLRGLLNNKLVTFNPGSFIHKEGDEISGIFLILTGNVEIIQRGSDTIREMSSGGIIGDMSALYERATAFSYRTVNYVHAMLFPVRLYQEFIIKNGLRTQIEHLYERRTFLQQTFLLGDSIPYPVQNRIAQTMTEHRFKKGELIDDRHLGVLNFVRQGRIESFIGRDSIEEIGEFGVFGEDMTFFSTSSVFSFRAAEDAKVYQLNGDIIKDIPIVRWKLIELSEKRRRMLLNIRDETSLVQWREEYAVNIREMDDQHKELFAMGSEVFSHIEEGAGIVKTLAAMDRLIEYSRYHFQQEEELLEKKGFRDLEHHRMRHRQLIKQIVDYRDSFPANHKNKNGIEFIRFFKEWMINHILVEDKRYGAAFALRK
ncbi:MAG: bacteriohemerythrin, partial [Gammaproteobacteria bacterium]